MSANVIDPNYNWKQAASQEGVDYDAVKKSFMDQAYGFVANKAKVLFQDPFRLGFEIVHRNEKATKMVGIFAFRCNDELLYAPVFFVNGEIKAADMLYRNDVKRFVPLTDKWCAYLVRGANKESGQLEDKGRPRQQDAHMDRLAYPHRIKYAGDEGINKEALLDELLAHCVDDSPLRKLVPLVIDSEGPDALSKLAAMIEGSDIAQRFVAENYTAEELSNARTWQEKQAAEAYNPEDYGITLITCPTLCKSAAERDSVMDKGYTLIDKRPAETVNTVVEEIENSTIYELNAPGFVSLLKSDGGSVNALLLVRDYTMLDRECPAPCGYAGGTERPDTIYLPGDKNCRTYFNGGIFGNASVIDGSIDVKTVKPDKGVTGKAYLLVNLGDMRCSEPLVITGVDKDGDASVINYVTRYGSPNKLFYAPGRETKTNTGYISDDIALLEVDADIKREGDRVTEIELKWDHVLMDSAGIDKWMRTAGGVTESVDVTIKKDQSTGLFTISSRGPSGLLKQSHDLGMLAAHLTLANDFELTCDAAGNLLNRAIDESVTRRVFRTLDKSAYVTRSEPMQQWIEGYDPALNVKTDAPQKQVLLTHTPKRQQQVQRYGDHWDRGHMMPRDPEEDGLPENALMTKSPEELARLSAEYNLPHIFDHGALSQMATSLFNTVTQIQQYIPDLESGVDRYFRILFLLRYRPADFEEAYGKDELMEMEQELSELANLAGENLLRMLKRFDPNKFTTQGS